MPADVAWYDEAQSIIYCKFDTRWDWDCFYAAIEKQRKMIRSQSHTVYVISDLRGTELPKDVFSHLRGLVRQRPTNAGPSVIVTDSKAVRILFETFLRSHASMTPGSALFAYTPEQALKLIAEHKQAYESQQPL